LSVENRPDYLWGLLAFGAAGFCALFTAADRMWLLFAGVFLVISGAMIYTERAIICRLNKGINRIAWTRNGILESGWGATSAEFGFRDVSAVEMKRHIERGADVYQIRLHLHDNRIFSLSTRSLGFSVCQHHAEQIRQFIGIPGPLQAVD